MALYEHVFMVRQDTSTAQVDNLTQQFKSVIEENGGKIGKTEYWGLKSLAYKIKKNRKAHYSLMNLDAPAAAVAEMERQMRLNDDVIRFMTIRVDELDDGQSAMMRPSRGRDDRGRDDRGPRGDRGRDDRPARSESKPADSEEK